MQVNLNDRTGIENPAIIIQSNEQHDILDNVHINISMHLSFGSSSSFAHSLQSPIITLFSSFLIFRCCYNNKSSFIQYTIINQSQLDSYNLKMSIVDQPSLNSITDQTSKSHISNKVSNAFEEVVHDPDHLNPIEQLANEGAETATPAKPPRNAGQAEGNPEAREGANQETKLIQENFQLTKKMIVIGILIILALVAVTITIVALLVTRNRFQIVVESGFTATKLANTGSLYETQRITAKDPETFNSSLPLPISVSRIRRPAIITPVIPIFGVRTLAEGDQVAQVDQGFAVYSFRDEPTGATIMVSSKDLQLRATFETGSLLQFVLNNQEFPQNVPDTRNLQETPTSAQDSSAPPPQPAEDVIKDYTFYAVNDKIVEKVKSVLVKQDKEVKVGTGQTIDIQFNESKGVFQFSPTVSTPPPETVSFFDPKATPAIKDTNNEQEVAKAVTTVVSGVLETAKKFLSRHMGDIEKASQVKLVQTDPTDGQTSIYVDKAEDICKLCANVDTNKFTCEDRAAESKALDLEPPTDGKKLQANPVIIIVVDM